MMNHPPKRRPTHRAHNEELRRLLIDEAFADNICAEGALDHIAALMPNDEHLQRQAAHALRKERQRRPSRRGNHRRDAMTDLRDKIADIIDCETNARLVQDEIDILNGHDVAQSIIAALPDMEAQAVEIARLREALEDIEKRSRPTPVGNPKWINQHARVALEAKP